jgi:tetratricopeptide (TPR) repeat protein
LDSGVQTNTVDELEQLRQQASEYAQAKEWAEARQAYSTLLQHDVEDEDALLGLAHALDMLGDYFQMLEKARASAQINPGSARALAYQARALQKLDRLSEATIANDQALLLDTNLALAWFNRGGQQLLQEHFPEALRYTERALELDSTDARAWANKGLALIQLNRQFEALEAVNQSLTCDPDYMVALTMKGEILRKYGRLQEVIQTMQHALEIAPNDVSSLSVLAHALRTQSSYQELLTITTQLVPLTPDSLFAWDSHTCALRGLGLFETATEAIEHVLELDPTNVRYMMIKADNLYRLQRYREAVSASELALQIDDEYPPALRIHEKAIRAMYQHKRKKK